MAGPPGGCEGYPLFAGEQSLSRARWTIRLLELHARDNAMPLKKGSSKAVVSSNIKTLVDDWKKEGSIGTSHPVTKKKAIRQAVAIALGKAGKSRGKSN